MGRRCCCGGTNPKCYWSQGGAPQDCCGKSKVGDKTYLPCCLCYNRYLDKVYYADLLTRGNILLPQIYAPCTYGSLVGQWTYYVVEGAATPYPSFATIYTPGAMHYLKFRKTFIFDVENKSGIVAGGFNNAAPNDQTGMALITDEGPTSDFVFQIGLGVTTDDFTPIYTATNGHNEFTLDSLDMDIFSCEKPPFIMYRWGLQNIPRLSTPAWEIPPGPTIITSYSYYNKFRGCQFGGTISNPSYSPNYDANTNVFNPFGGDIIFHPDNQFLLYTPAAVGAGSFGVNSGKFGCIQTPSVYTGFLYSISNMKILTECNEEFTTFGPWNELNSMFELNDINIKSKVNMAEREDINDNNPCSPIAYFDTDGILNMDTYDCIVGKIQCRTVEEIREALGGSDGPLLSNFDVPLEDFVGEIVTQECSDVAFDDRDANLIEYKSSWLANGSIIESTGGIVESPTITLYKFRHVIKTPSIFKEDEGNEDCERSICMDRFIQIGERLYHKQYMFAGLEYAYPTPESPIYVNYDAETESWKGLVQFNLANIRYVKSIFTMTIEDDIMTLTQVDCYSDEYDLNRPDITTQYDLSEYDCVIFDGFIKDDVLCSGPSAGNGSTYPRPNVSEYSNQIQELGFGSCSQ